MTNQVSGWVPSVVWGILLAVLSLMPGQQSNLLLFGIPHIDKIAHFGMYGIWSFLVFRAWNNHSKNSAQKIMWLTFLLATVSGLILEIGQITLTVGRTFEMSDIIANALGSLGGVLAGRLLSKKIITPGKG